jgi:hypothetical protein
MSRLITSPQISNPDAFYADLMDAVRGLDAEASLRFCARLVLLLANHIGKEEVLQEALRCAREAANGSSPAARVGTASGRNEGA